MEIQKLISIDPEVLSGKAVFSGTRVSIETLFDHLEQDIPLEEFLEDFPSVSREQVIAALELASKFLSSKNIARLYEIAA